MKITHIVRTYNGEPASECGLDESSPVLCWDKMYAVWYLCEFARLEKGDQWMKQPPAPETDGNAMSNDNETPAGSENIATPLTDAVWLMDDELEEIQNKSWCVENCNYNLGQFLTRKYGPPSRIADLERQLAEAKADTQRLDWLMGDVVNTPVSPWMSISRTDIDSAMTEDSQ